MKYIAAHKPHAKDVYHSNPDCAKLVNGSQPITDTSQNPNELRLCESCRGGIDNSGSKRKRCPYCGERVSRLPDHLPCEEQP